ncbi:MAG: hypothetical protein ABI144_06150 [Gallionella sp.]
MGQYVLKNVGPDDPFSGGIPVRNFEVAKPEKTGQIMQFCIISALAPDPTTSPRNLALPAIQPVPRETVTRHLALLEHTSITFHDEPTETMLGTVNGNPNTGPAALASQM